MKKILCLLLLVFFVSCKSTSDDLNFQPGSQEEVGGGSATTGGGGSDGSTGQEVPIANFSPEVINDFLWKPESERNGDLVVLINPVGVRIEVVGSSASETLADSGPSNGRGTTGRGSLTGCSYGSSVVVTFFDSLDRQILVADGRDSVVVPNGCDRLEFRL